MIKIKMMNITMVMIMQMFLGITMARAMITMMTEIMLVRARGCRGWILQRSVVAGCEVELHVNCNRE